MVDHFELALLAVFCFLQVVDYETTVRALELRNLELNPTLAWLQRRFGRHRGTFFAKVLAIGLVFGAWVAGYMPALALGVLDVFYCIVALGNLRAIRLKEAGR